MILSSRWLVIQINMGFRIYIVGDCFSIFILIFLVFLPPKSPARDGNSLGKTMLPYVFFRCKFCASSFQPACLAPWGCGTCRKFLVLPLHIAGMELMSADCSFQLCCPASKAPAAGTIHNCVLCDGTRTCAFSFFSNYCQLAETSNDSNTEAVCFSDGN